MNLKTKITGIALLIITALGAQMIPANASPLVVKGFISARSVGDDNCTVDLTVFVPVTPDAGTVVLTGDNGLGVGAPNSAVLNVSSAGTALYLQTNGDNFGSLLNSVNVLSTTSTQAWSCGQTLSFKLSYQVNGSPAETATALSITPKRPFIQDDYVAGTITPQLTASYTNTGDCILTVSGKFPTDVTVSSNYGVTLTEKPSGVNWEGLFPDKVDADGFWTLHYNFTSNTTPDAHTFGNSGTNAMTCGKTIAYSAFYRFNSTVHQGTPKTIDMFAPAPCDTGSYSATGLKPCVLASPGNYVDLLGATSQTPCPAGAYSNDDGSVTCQLAHAGSYVPSMGMREEIQCPPGTFVNYTGAQECDTVPNLTWSGFGAIAPTNCPEHTYTDSEGSRSINDCFNQMDQFLPWGSLPKGLKFKKTWKITNLSTGNIPVTVKVSGQCKLQKPTIKNAYSTVTAGTKKGKCTVTVTAPGDYYHVALSEKTVVVISKTGK